MFPTLLASGAAGLRSLTFKSVGELITFISYIVYIYLNLIPFHPLTFSEQVLASRAWEMCFSVGRTTLRTRKTLMGANALSLGRALTLSPKTPALRQAGGYEAKYLLISWSINESGGTGMMENP